MKILFRSVLLGAIFMMSTYFYFSTGKTGSTQLNGIGCFCHGLNPSPEVNVWIEGENRINPGDSTIFKINVTGGPAVAAGFNIAVSNGFVNSIDSSVQVIENELTHDTPKLFNGDTLSWLFRYKAPEIFGKDTFWSVANSVDHSGQINNDKWNYGEHFIITIADSITKVEEQKNIVNTFKLHQNYPNPFNPTTKIKFSSDELVNISLKIYDVLGRVIDEPVNESKINGDFIYEFNGRNYKSGIYFCEVIVDNEKSEIIKMVLLK